MYPHSLEVDLSFLEETIGEHSVLGLVQVTSHNLLIQAGPPNQNAGTRAVFRGSRRGAGTSRAIRAVELKP